MSWVAANAPWVASAPLVDEPPPPCVGFEAGSDGLVVVTVAVVVVVVVLVLVVTAGGPGSGLGAGVGSGCGCGVGPSHVPERWLFRAWTSTSWPPEHGASLCGWLFPGPCSTALPGAPFCSAIPPAV